MCLMIHGSIITCGLQKVYKPSDVRRSYSPFSTLGGDSRRGTEVVITGPTRNRLSWETGTVGSNPTLSANLFALQKNGEISPKGFWRIRQKMCKAHFTCNK
jgi:hypothetical protein